MRYFFAAILLVGAVLAYYYVLRIIYYKKYSTKTYKASSWIALSSATWGLGYGIMQLTNNFLVYEIFRIVGLFGIVLFLISGQMAIGMLTESKNTFRPFIKVEAVCGIAILVIMALPSTYTIEATPRGIMTGFASASVSIIYTVYYIVVASFFLYLTLKMRGECYPRRVRSLGDALLKLMGFIGIGLIIDTILPSFGINFNIPASSVLQFVGLFIICKAITKHNEDTINFENMTRYIYQTINSPVAAFDSNHILRLANDKAKELFELPDIDGVDSHTVEDYNFWYTCFNQTNNDFMVISDTNATINMFYEKKQMHFSLTIAPIFDSYQEYIGYIVVFMDMTDQFNSMKAITQAKHDAEKAQREAEHAREMAEMANRTNNLKSDFLANMSHEIRTPMNAIIGMAEMALRTELPVEAVDYVSQIKSSGNALLGIINDILDFSKIESGKMDIINEDFDVLSNIHDTGNILMTRLQDKDVELLTAINPDIPCMLHGDNLRIRQILINLANNAIKFTNNGHVKVSMDYEKIDDSHIKLMFDVEDTGIGISNNDIEKIFDSFQQVDSKRNRAVEGTGLGLAICLRLVKLLGGDINVRSEYGKGSVFSFWVPQQVANWAPCIERHDTSSIVAYGSFKKKCIANIFFKEMGRLGVNTFALSHNDYFEKSLSYNNEQIKDKQIVYYLDDQTFDDEMIEFTQQHPEINFIVFTSFFSSQKSKYKNVKFAKKPVSTVLLSMTISNDDSGIRREAIVTDFDFTAPDARILIVDDSEINLTVAKGLLQPLNMQIDTALSGVAALDSLSKNEYDIVFMDHMMPEMDGVETTRVIRRLHPDLEKMPIIALTANAVREAREMFLSEGMSDFIAKPIELRSLILMVRKWLPESKIKKGTGEISELVDSEAQTNNDIPVIGDLDVETALKLIGSLDVYWKVLNSYYQAMDKKSTIIEDSWKSNDISTYTIEVHALKSASRQIGAMELADLAAMLEQAGKEGDMDTINTKTHELLGRYMAYQDVLRPYVSEPEVETEKVSFDKDKLFELFDQLHTACDELDMDAMESTCKEIGRFEFDEASAEYYKQVKECVSNLDSFTCDEVIGQWKEGLSN